MARSAFQMTCLNRARTLFARAIEAPGGLKIQTIHSFCASVLRRFPLEARVSPAFTEIDERVQARLLADLLDELAEDEKGRAALDLVAPHLPGDDGAVALARAVAGKAEELTPPAEWAEICASAGIDPGLTEDDVIAEVIVGGEVDLARAVLPHLDPDVRSTAAAHRALSQADWSQTSFADLSLLEGAFLFGAKTKTPFRPQGRRHRQQGRSRGDRRRHGTAERPDSAHRRRPPATHRPADRAAHPCAASVRGYLPSRLCEGKGGARDGSTSTT